MINHKRICAVGAVYKNDNPDFFRAALESVFNQSNITFDVHIVVDGPIGKELEQILEEYYPNIFLTELSTSRGLGSALKEVFETKIYGHYDIAIRFDSDDINYPDRFKILVDKMVDEDLQLVGSHIHEIDNNSKIIGARVVPLNQRRINFLKNLLSPFNHPSVALDVEALKKVGGYKNCYMFEDWFLWLHFLKENYKVANIDKFLVGFRMNQGTIDRRYGGKYRSYERNFYFTAIKHGLLNPFVGFVCLIIRQFSKLIGRNIFQFFYRILHQPYKKKINN